MQAWRRIRSAHISAVCDTVEDRAKQMAERWRVPAWYTDLADMIQREDLQFLSICTPPLAHVDQARMAIEAGVNAVVEKPLAMTAKDVEEIAEICQRSKARLTVISNLLFTPAVARARRILASLHDEPISLDLTFLKPATSDYMAGDPSHWSHSLPGGIFGEMLFHPLYLISFFLGELSVRGIYLDKLGTQDWLHHDELTVFLGSARKRATIRTFLKSPRYSISLDLYGQKYALGIDLGTNDVFVFRDSKASPAAKVVDCTRQASAVFENIRGAVLRGISYHLGIKHGPHEFNIRSFVENDAQKKPSVISLEDAYKITLIQEEITTLIEKGGAPHNGVSASPYR
jgi:predicted dehydrogenase